MRELVGVTRSKHDDGRFVLLVLLFYFVAVLILHRQRNARMGVHRIAVFIEDVVHSLYRIVFASKACVEVLIQKSFLFRRNGIFLLVCKVLHTRQSKLCVSTADFKEQTLDIGSHHHVHRRGHGTAYVTLCVVRTRLEEIGKRLVSIRCANKLADGQAHALCIPTSKDVAKVTRRRNEVYLVAVFNLSGRPKVDIRREVVSDLRSNTRKVDGVCASKTYTLFRKVCVKFFGSEHSLHGALTIVKASLYRRRENVVPRLRAKLQALHFCHAFVRIEYGNLRAFHVAEALHRPLARVAARRRQNKQFFLNPHDLTALFQ